MNKLEYRQYLQSDHWKNLKRRKLQKRGKRGPVGCGICGSRHRLDTHHLRYRNIYDVKLSDLRIICRRCHFLGHDLMRSGKLKVDAKGNGNRWFQFSAGVKAELGMRGDVTIRKTPRPKRSLKRLVNLIEQSKKRRGVIRQLGGSCWRCGTGKSLSLAWYTPLPDLIAEHQIETLPQAHACEALWNPENSRPACVKCLPILG